MIIRLCAFIGSLSIIGSSALAGGGCNTATRISLIDTQRIVDSLRPDKPGQMRVYALDGSEYTAGLALWMKGQLRLITIACAKGDDAAAAPSLQAVLDTLKAHGAAVPPQPR